MRLFPNPTDNNFTLDLGVDQMTSPINVTVYDMSGKEIESVDHVGVRYLNLMISEPPGVYLVVVKSDKRLATFELVKH